LGPKSGRAGRDLTKNTKQVGQRRSNQRNGGGVQKETHRSSVNSGG